MFWWWKADPGPCPVDDAPHTTCTSQGYIAAPYPSTAQQTVSVSAPLPAATGTAGGSAAPKPAPEPSTTFTTKTYRRRPKASS